MTTLIIDLARAVAFLSRFPVDARRFDDADGALSTTVRAFPLAGLAIALPAAVLAALLVAIDAPALVAAVLVVGLQVLVTGALHEDGLADTADGLGAGHCRQRALEIMKDSRTGVYGVVALGLALILRVAALAALFSALTVTALALVLLAVAASSRATMVRHWASLPPAKPDGVAVAAGAPDRKSARTALISGMLIALVLLWLAMGPVPALSALAAVAAVDWVFTTRTKARLGGFTGDTIGAAQQLTELVLLAVLALWL